MLVVAARTSGDDSDHDGITLFAVPKDATGMSLDVVRFGGSSAAVVEVLGDEQTPPLQVLGVTTDRGETIDAVYVRAERPVLLDQTPDAPWGAVALCD